ncbi:hypothetical protein CKO25_19790 [Thiocapsa imhoffii]|uniref:Uncharacterized protein n=1 Tax=Thiocapsa imhoffii TaxID=382777 RepID=A0A9X1BAB0_9GAMM|nr:hypothetical protein [Thiocapsa imhoffii]MBK1646834.1 hypothetical protein [Thiocapsa imhoffii]
MNFVGSEDWLDARQLAELDGHLQQHLHQSAESVARCVNERWGMSDTASGMTDGWWVDQAREACLHQ